MLACADPSVRRLTCHDGRPRVTVVVHCSPFIGGPDVARGPCPPHRLRLSQHGLHVARLVGAGPAAVQAGGMVVVVNLNVVTADGAEALEGMERLA